MRTDCNTYAPMLYSTAVWPWSANNLECVNPSWQGHVKNKKVNLDQATSYEILKIFSGACDLNMLFFFELSGDAFLCYNLIPWPSSMLALKANLSSMNPAIYRFAFASIRQTIVWPIAFWEPNKFHRESRSCSWISGACRGEVPGNHGFHPHKCPREQWYGPRTMPLHKVPLLFMIITCLMNMWKRYFRVFPEMRNGLSAFWDNLSVVSICLAMLCPCCGLRHHFQAASQTPDIVPLFSLMWWSIDCRVVSISGASYNV